MRAELAQLHNAIRSIEERGCTPTLNARSVLRTGWESIDSALIGGLARSVVHEWFGSAGPPLALLIHLASRAIADQEPMSSHPVLWIGRQCWPYPHVLNAPGHRLLLRRSIFIDPPDNPSRLWTIDQALRSRGLAATIADGRGMTMPHSRRLQLAAEAGGALALLARPTDELDSLSASATRWLVRPMPSPPFKPRWIVELLRCRGRQPATEAQHRWALELDRATGSVGFPAIVGDRSGAMARSETDIPTVASRRSA